MNSALSILATLARIAYGALFVYAGAIKVADASGFAQAVFNYQILPGMLVNAVALLLPACEVVCGLALCLNVLARGAAVVLNSLLVVFLAALGLAVWRGIDVDCGCFGGAHQGVDTFTIWRDVAFLALGLVAMWGVFARRKG